MNILSDVDEIGCVCLPHGKIEPARATFNLNVALCLPVYVWSQVRCIQQPRLTWPAFQASRMVCCTAGGATVSWVMPCKPDGCAACDCSEAQLLNGMACALRGEVC